MSTLLIFSCTKDQISTADQLSSRGGLTAEAGGGPGPGTNNYCATDLYACDFTDMTDYYNVLTLNLNQVIANKYYNISCQTTILPGTAASCDTPKSLLETLILPIDIPILPYDPWKYCSTCDSIMCDTCSDTCKYVYPYYCKYDPRTGDSICLDPCLEIYCDSTFNGQYLHPFRITAAEQVAMVDYILTAQVVPWIIDNCYSGNPPPYPIVPLYWAFEQKDKYYPWDCGPEEGYCYDSQIMLRIQYCCGF